jgi:hypothetical protein
MSFTFLVMQSLRRRLEIHVVDARDGLLAFLVDFYGEVGTAELAHSAADAELGTLGPCLASLKDKDLLGAEGHADVAALAIALAQDMDENFLG